MAIKAIRKLFGIEKFEMPIDPPEFAALRPVLESHLSGDWCMGKTPQHSAIQVHLDGSYPHLEQRLKEIANARGFEIDISYGYESGYGPARAL